MAPSFVESRSRRDLAKPRDLEPRGDQESFLFPHSQNTKKGKSTKYSSKI